MQVDLKYLRNRRDMSRLVKRIEKNASGLGKRHLEDIYESPGKGGGKGQTTTTEQWQRTVR